MIPQEPKGFVGTVHVTRRRCLQNASAGDPQNLTTALVDVILCGAPAPTMGDETVGKTDVPRGTLNGDKWPNHWDQAKSGKDGENML
jgi:hypothetical protein